MGIDTAVFQPNVINNEKPKTFMDAVVEISRNRRAVTLLSYMFPESSGDLKISVGILRNMFATKETLKAGLIHGVYTEVGVVRDPQQSDQEYNIALEQKRQQYVAEAVFVITNALAPIYDQFSNPQALERKKSPSTRTKIIGEFTAYFNQNYAKILRAYQAGQSLTDIFYRDFYGKDVFQEQFEEESLKARVIKERYSKLLEKNVKEAEALVKGKNAVIVQDEYWQHTIISGGVGKSKIGRIYLNVHPLDAPFIFRRAIELFSHNGMGVQAKIPLNMDYSAINRTDKMVIYFKDEQDTQVIQVIEQLYRSNSNSFQEGIPKFTAQIHDSGGSILQGLGFGEEPLSGNESFGEVRSSILADVTSAAGQKKLRIDDPRFPFEQLFIQACQEKGVNQDNPAFNAVSGRFSEIRKRIIV